ncbi:MAG TPA: hypothetical protein VHW69_07695 [Rhizomicrobium sp.]|jgi:hypothetical protein|nr:hypothetical protein [Rhizomicrobium sp.]
MPRLNKHIKECVFYLYGKDPKTGERRGPLGSGVLVERDPPDVNALLFSSPRISPMTHVYAVTSYHAAVTKGASIIRINSIADGDFAVEQFIEREPHEWSFIPGGDDIAITDVTDDIRFESGKRFDSFNTLSESSFVTADFIKEAEITIGEDGFMLGLFTRNPGYVWIEPAARFGNLSQLAQLHNPIVQGHGIAHPSHVFDIHSRPGFSGSPVFIYRTPAADLSSFSKHPGRDHKWMLSTKNNVFLGLLGIHSGQFMDDLTASKNDEAYGQMPIYDGDSITVPSSMTIVAPAWAITKALDHPNLKEQREMREERSRKARKQARHGVRPEVAEAEAKAEPETDNPSHKEDFTSLLGRAARAKPKGGRT